MTEKRKMTVCVECKHHFTQCVFVPAVKDWDCPKDRRVETEHYCGAVLLFERTSPVTGVMTRKYAVCGDVNRGDCKHFQEKGAE